MAGCECEATEGTWRLADARPDQRDSEQMILVVINEAGPALYCVEPRKFKRKFGHTVGPRPLFRSLAARVNTVVIGPFIVKVPQGLHSRSRTLKFVLDGESQVELGA